MASHWTWRLALALLGLGLAGCSGNDSFDSDCIPAPGPITEPESGPGLVLTGQHVRMEVTPTANVAGCGTIKSEVPSFATVEIEGPEGELLPGKVTLAQQFREPAIVEFTPERPGPHHIVVTFSPVGGLHQFDLHAVWDRSAEAPLEMETLPQSCSSLERTSKGAWVCNSSVVRGSTVLRTFNGASLAVAGDVIWVVDLYDIQRYVDTGSDLVLSATYRHNRGAVGFLLASPDEVTVLYRTFFLASYFFSAGALTTSGTSVSVPTELLSPGGDLVGILLRDGERVGVVTGIAHATPPAIQVCPYLLEPGRIVPPQGPCPSVVGHMAGFEPGVLWTQDPPGSNVQTQKQRLVRRWRWTQDQLLEQGSIGFGLTAYPFSVNMKGWEHEPFVRNSLENARTRDVMGVLTWSPQRQKLYLEHYGSSPEGVSASRAFFWGESSGSATIPTRVRLRPPPL